MDGRGGGSYLSRLAGEVVGRLERAADTLLQRGVATVVGTEDGVLEAAGVLDVDVQLAVLAGLGDGDTGADGGDIGVEDEGDDGPVRGDLGADTALGAASSTIGHAADGDLVLVSHCSQGLQQGGHTWPGGGASPSSWPGRAGAAATNGTRARNHFMFVLGGWEC